MLAVPCCETCFGSTGFGRQYLKIAVCMGDACWVRMRPHFIGILAGLLTFLILHILSRADGSFALWVRPHTFDEGLTLARHKRHLKLARSSVSELKQKLQRHQTQAAGELAHLKTRLKQNEPKRPA